MPNDQVEISTGLKDTLLSMLTSILGDVKISFPGDKEKLKAFIKAGGEWAKSITTVRWDLDDLGINKLIELIESFVDSYKEAPAAPSGPMVVGAASTEVVYTTADVTSFMSGFSGAIIPEETKQKMLANPKILNYLKKLSRENQIKVMNRQDLMDLLIKWGPVILRIVLMIITVI